jgi:hypothetical protein
MALSTYAELQAEVLNWLARPGDPLVAPAVPTMISLFEREASRRLRVGAAETVAFLAATGGEGAVVLPSDCGTIRTVSAYTQDLSRGQLLLYLPPTDSGLIWDSRGPPRYYTVYGGHGATGAFLQLGPAPDTGGTVVLNYMRDLPPLSNDAPSNWLLRDHGDAYLFGSLAEAELYIGHDERAGLWAQRREAVFASIQAQDIKKRWPGPMQIRVDGLTTPGGAPSAATTGLLSDGPVVVIRPVNAETVLMEQHWRSVYVATAPATLTITLPPNGGMAQGEVVDINFSAPVSALTFLQSPGGPVAHAPTTGYGPGAAIVWRWVDGSWILWK